LRENLVGKVSEHLRRGILNRELLAGSKLPNEAGLAEQYSVSRTVIREAIAALKADGLVEARHGVGMFVLSNQPAAALTAQHFDPDRISSVIEMLELRAAIEIEAAGLAAVRCSPAQEEAIWDAYKAIGRLMEERQSTTTADFEFHLGIAGATNNPKFVESLQMMGSQVIPRSSLQQGQGEVAPQQYLARIQGEHRHIVEAISQRDPERARKEMRVHLNGSLERYRNMVRPK